MGARAASHVILAALLAGCAALSIPGGSAVRTVPCIRAARAAPGAAEPAWNLAPHDEIRSASSSGDLVRRPVILALESALDPRSGEFAFATPGAVVPLGAGKGYASVSRHPEAVTRIADDHLAVVWFTSHDHLGFELVNLGIEPVAVVWESSSLVEAGGDRRAILPAMACLVAAQAAGTAPAAGRQPGGAEGAGAGPAPLEHLAHRGRWNGSAIRSTLERAGILSETILFDRQGEFRPRRPYDAFGIVLRIETGGRPFDYTFQFAPAGADPFSWFPVGSDFPPFIPR